jgi:hypothetical protein
MGNSHVFFHRLPAISASCLATVGLAFAVSAGTSCSFLEVNPSNGHFLQFYQGNGLILEISSSTLGILCENKYYDLEGDLMRELSRIFLLIALGFGICACALAWSLASVLAPSDCTWKLLSILSAVIAVIQVPIFLIFEAVPCTEQNCSISSGVYFLIMSTLSWIAVTVVTQCTDVPLWAIERNGWRVQNGELPTVTHRKRKTSRLQAWRERRQRGNLVLAPTESGSNDDDKALADLMENGSYYADSTNSRLLLKVEDGRRPGDDQRSVTTFGDLDDDVRMAEAERLDPLLGKMIYPEDELEPDLLGEADADMRTKETMIICGLVTEPTQYYSDPKAFQNGDDDLFDNEEAVKLARARSMASSDAERTNSNIVYGIRALTDKVKHVTSGRFPAGKKYSSIVDEGELYSPPRSKVSKEILHSIHPPTEILLTPPEIHRSDHESELLHDWNVLHAAATSGIFLPTTGLISAGDEEPEPIPYATEGSASVLSLSTFGHQPDREDASSISGSSFDDSIGTAEGENIIIAEVRRRQQMRRRRNRGHFSGAHSVCSLTSLLDLTIAEETDFQLREFDVVIDEKIGKRNLHQPYEMGRTKSAPGAFSNHRQSASIQGHRSPSSKLDGLVECSPFAVESSELSLGSVRHGKAVTSDSSVFDADTDQSLGGAMYSSDARSEGYSPSVDESRGRTRARSMTLPRKKQVAVNPIVTPEKKFYPSSLLDMPTYRSERILKAGIHSPVSAVVSDDSSASGEDESVGGRSSRSNFSHRIARRARMERLQSDNKRRSRTLDPPVSRKPMSIINIVDFDPSLNIVWKSRSAGLEYGPDEASL